MTYAWHPSGDYLDHSNVARLMRTLGVTTADELRARSVADIGAFWDAVVRDLGIEFRTPYSRVVEGGRSTSSMRPWGAGRRQRPARPRSSTRRRTGPCGG